MFHSDRFLFPLPEKKILLNRSEKNCFIKKMNNTSSFIKMSHSGWGSGYAIPYPCNCLDYIPAFSFHTFLHEAESKISKIELNCQF